MASSAASSSAARLVAALEETDGSEKLLTLHRQRSIRDCVSCLPVSQRDFVASLLLERLPSALQRAAECALDETQQQQLVEKQNKVVEVTTALLSVADASVNVNESGRKQTTKTRTISATLFAAIQMLHDSLLSLPHPAASSLQNSISQLCERLYTKKYIVKPTVTVPDVDGMSMECLLPMTISYLLLRALEAGGGQDGGESGKRADILRLYSLRHAFNSFDYSDPSSETLKHLLVRAAIHPLFLRCIEGRRFLSFVFVQLGVGHGSAEELKTNSEMMLIIHTAMKQQLPLCKLSFITLYADVYVRAWKSLQSPSTESSSATAVMSAHAASIQSAQLLAFEQDIIQDLMHASIHCAHVKSSTAIRSLLHSSFHDLSTKRSLRVEEMLARLWEPILWRALKAANPLARKQAAEVFLDAFPLVNPELDSNEGSGGSGGSNGSCFESNQELQQYQIDTLVALLKDEDVSIRVVGVAGVCRILNAYWELLPLSVCKALCTHLVKEAAVDAAAGAAGVRAAVVRGLAGVLDNVLSHPLLKVLLPRLSPLLFDSSEVVQLSFADLLLIVKKVRGIAYYEVCPVEEILLALSTTKSMNLVDKLLTLVLNSYFPSPKKDVSVKGSVESSLLRCMTLLRSYPHAFLILVRHLRFHEGQVSIQRRNAFTMAWFQMIVNSVRKQTHKFTKKRQDDGDDDEEENDGASSKPRAKKRSKSSASTSSSDPLVLDVENEMGLFETSLCALVSLVRQWGVIQEAGDAAVSSAISDEGVDWEEVEQSNPGMVREVIECFAGYSEDDSSDASSKPMGRLGLLLATIGSKSAPARLSLIQLASLLPDACAPDLRGISLPHLLSLGPTAPLAEYGPILECMVAWGRVSHVLATAHTTLALAFSNDVQTRDTVFRGGEEANKLAQGFRRNYRSKQKEMLQAMRDNASKNKKKKGKKSRVNKATVEGGQMEEDEEQPLLHPLMAIRYLAYLFEHERTRTAVLTESLEWGIVSEESASSATSKTGGRIVGYLAEILSLLSDRLMPSLRMLIEGDDEEEMSGRSLTEEEEDARTQARLTQLNFVHQATQLHLKANLHVHARLKVMAQKAVQRAMEQSEAEAEAKAIENGDDSTNKSTASAAAASVTVIPLFPRGFEELLDYSTHVLLPLWPLVLDQPGWEEHEVGKSKQDDDENEHKEQDDDGKGSKSKKPKRSKDSPMTATKTVFSSNNRTHLLRTPGQLLVAHFQLLMRFVTELATLGTFHPRCPLQHVLDWIQHFDRMRTNKIESASSHSVGDGQDVAASSSTTASLGQQTQQFLVDFLPVAFKFLYQLAVIGSLTPGFGSKKPLPPSESANDIPFTFFMFSDAFQGVIGLVTSLGVDNDNEAQAQLVAHPLVKTSIGSILTLLCGSAASSKHLRMKTVWMIIESMVDDEKCKWGPLLPRHPVNTTTELSPLNLVLLASIARTPQALLSLPRALEDLASSLAALAPANEQALIERTGAAVSALALMAEVHVKAEQKRATYLNALLQCTQRLSQLAGSSSGGGSSSNDSPAPTAPAPAHPHDGPIGMDIENASSTEEDDKENSAQQPQAHPMAGTDGIDQQKSTNINQKQQQQYASNVLWNKLQESINAQLQQLSV